METYELQKAVCDDEDFAVLGWHDATIWSTVANVDTFEFIVDLDYIFMWVHPCECETYFKFWVAPVTMVFEDAHDVRIDIDSQSGSIEVADFHREAPEPTRKGFVGKSVQHTYRFQECQQGGDLAQVNGVHGEM
jgi:hypothetical protein